MAFGPELSEKDLLDHEKFKCLWDGVSLAGELLIVVFGGRCLDTKTGDFVNVKRKMATIDHILDQVKKVGFKDFWCPKCERPNRLQQHSGAYMLTRSP